MVQPLLTARVITVSGAVLELGPDRAGRAAGRRGVAVRGREAVRERAVAERERAAVVRPRADPARARVVVVLRDLPAMASG
ncbi:hypothetical protein [Nocardia donostiensis]|uniref:hypothetical protein n=1 Tax=Nocardia donostiensis TaxID=1538463 RepID=UPI0009DA7CED|nr:hypothetical protein [Nocardia donostiensis]